MVVAALIIAIIALVASALVALAVMELIANGTTSPTQPEHDKIENLEVPDDVMGTLAGSHGLPASIHETDRHMALIVSPMCTTCSGIVGSFDGVVPNGLTVLVTASQPRRHHEWITMHGLKLGDAVFDEDMSIVNSLRVSSSPTVIGFGAGRVAFMVGIGGRTALDELLEQRVTGP